MVGREYVITNKLMETNSIALSELLGADTSSTHVQAWCKEDNYPLCIYFLVETGLMSHQITSARPSNTLTHSVEGLPMLWPLQATLTPKFKRYIQRINPTRTCLLLIRHVLRHDTKVRVHQRFRERIQ